MRVWDISNRRQPVLLAALPTTGGIISFSPDGNFLATSLNDRGIEAWDMNLDDITHRLCQNIGTIITASQWSEYLPGQTYAPPCRP